MIEKKTIKSTLKFSNTSIPFSNPQETNAYIFDTLSNTKLNKLNNFLIFSSNTTFTFILILHNLILTL